MSHLALPMTVALSLALAACGTQPVAPPAPRSQQPGNQQLELSLASGVYACENGVRMQLDREIRDQRNTRIHIGWNGNSYWLERDPSYSGLPRFKDASSGLVWVDLPWKGLLLDESTGTPLANECRSL